MLTKPDHKRRNAVRPSRSLRNEYEDFIQQRIEDYKNQLRRNQLLHIADEAVREMDPGAAGQLALTEMLILEQVDRLIIDRLNLPTFARWKRNYSGLRIAQRQATHWHIEPDCPVTTLVLRLEPDETVLVVGKRCVHYGHYLAAHDNPVMFVADDLNTVHDAERRARVEVLASRFEALAVDFRGAWFPDVMAALVVLDPRALIELPAVARARLVAALCERTIPGGIHFIAFGEGEFEDSAFGVAQLRGLYSDWNLDEVGTGVGGLLATKQLQG